MCLAAGLEEELFRPDDEQMKDFYAELPISIRVKGDYHEFGNFVSGVAALPRIVTVSGTGIARPGNIETLIGTPVSHLIAASGGYTRDVERLLIGGPMMGYAIGSDAVPVIKTTNCLLLPTATELPPPAPAPPTDCSPPRWR